jgi:IclR family transcriptional regulator, KDG regulon repressor
MPGQSNIDRALAILRHLARHPGEHGVRALSAALDMSPSTTFRLLESLERAGFVHQNQSTSKYTIGVQAVQLGIAALGAFDLTALAPPYLQGIVAETGESAFLAVLDDGDVVYLLKEEGRYAIRTTATLGSRRPLHCTALGKSFLATMPAAEARGLLERKGMAAFTPHTLTDMARLWEDLARVRLCGYAVDREEIEEGLMCLGAPIRNYTGQTIAALSMAGPVGRLAPHEERYGRRIAATALEISQALGYTPRQVPEPQVELL